VFVGAKLASLSKYIMHILLNFVQILVNVDYMMKCLWHGAYMPKEKRTKFSERWRSNMDINQAGKPETKKPLLTEFTSAG
jgi:hypothetical protein